MTDLYTGNRNRIS